MTLLSVCIYLAIYLSFLLSLDEPDPWCVYVCVFVANYKSQFSLKCRKANRLSHAVMIKSYAM